MDKPLQTLLRLYGEAAPSGEAASAEDAALADLKTRLDARPRVRPDAAVLDAVFAAAAHYAPPQPTPGVRHDRLPVRPRHRWMRRAAWLAAPVCAVLMAVLVLPEAPTAIAPAAPTVAAAPPEPAPAAVATVLPEGEALPAPAEARPKVAAPPAEKAAAPALAWEDDTEARKLEAIRSRMATLQARLDSVIWDAPGQRLGLPQGQGAGRFTQARQ